VLTAFVAFACAIAVSSLATPLVRDLARRWGLLDHALSSRKAHGQPVPRLGGIAITMGFFAPLVGLLFIDSSVGRLFTADASRVVGLFTGGVLIAALGIYDDVKGADARKKFAVQFTAAALMYALGYRIDSLSVPFLGAVELGLAGLPLTVLWIAGVTNAVNLIDGLDGLAEASRSSP
jgi:UDP-GlcNAc:undecaprenyl-phosphate GlcNAc-1-phosphate transferase